MKKGTTVTLKGDCVSWCQTDNPTITSKIAMILNICECVNLEDFDEVNGAFNNIHQTMNEILWHIGE